MRVQTRRGLLQYSLLPSSQLLYGKLTVNQCEGLYQLSRSSAKKCLASLIDQLRRSLEELHNENIAHMDVRLANIGITRSFTVKLIDLDRCEPADNEVRACFVYQYRGTMPCGDFWFPALWSVWLTCQCFITSGCNLEQDKRYVLGSTSVKLLSIHSITHPRDCNMPSMKADATYQGSWEVHSR